jgi:hypothetical protein
MRAFLFALPLFLAACAGPIETRIDNAGLSSVEPTSFAIDSNAIGLVAGVQSKAASILTDKGFRQSEKADLMLQVTVSDRPANLALQNGSVTLSPSASKKRCAKRDYRVGVMLVRLADGATYYRSTAAEFHCKLTLEQALAGLVSAALADVGNPKGNYTINRSRP